MPCFPRLYAAASLKPTLRRVPWTEENSFSAALCRGLIEATIMDVGAATGAWFSAALCRGLIEASRSRCVSNGVSRRFPRLYAAASLKRGVVIRLILKVIRFSAALCRGLIEARPRYVPAASMGQCFPRLYAAASLKPYRAQGIDDRTMRFPRLYAAASLKLHNWSADQS